MFDCVTYDLLTDGIFLLLNATESNPQILEFPLVFIVLRTTLRLQRLCVLILSFLKVGQTTIKLGNRLRL